MLMYLYTYRCMAHVVLKVIGCTFGIDFASVLVSHSQCGPLGSLGKNEGVIENGEKGILCFFVLHLYLI